MCLRNPGDVRYLLKTMIIVNAKTKPLCVLTGAGISAESGVPTFRGGGKSVVWKGMPFDEISSARMVAEDLDAVWEWFDYRRGILKDCKPNNAHLALAEFEDSHPDFQLVTQNIDGLHQRAGSSNVIELHGNINRARCTECAELVLLKYDEIPHEPQLCTKCGSDLRPDVVLFGEMLPFGAFERASEAASNCTGFLVIGTSALVYPAAMLPEIAKRNGAFLVEVNPEDTALSSICDASHRGSAGDLVPEILKEWRMDRS